MVDGAGRIEASAWERRSQGFGYHRQPAQDWTAVALDPTGAARRLESRLPVRPQTSPAKGKSTVERGYYRVAAVPHRAATGPTNPSASRDSTN
jgi:hypothetical protein